MFEANETVALSPGLAVDPERHESPNPNLIERTHGDAGAHKRASSDPHYRIQKHTAPIQDRLRTRDLISPESDPQKQTLV